MRNEYCVTWKLYKSWIIENMLKGTKVAFSIFWCIFGVILLWKGISGGVSTFYLILAMFCLYRAIFRDLLFGRKQYNALVKTYGQDNWMRVIWFGEDNISLEEGNISLNFLYSDIVNIQEKNDKIWITFNNKSVIRLYKSAFVNTDWEKCKAKILG